MSLHVRRLHDSSDRHSTATAVNVAVGTYDGVVIRLKFEKQADGKIFFSKRSINQTHSGCVKSMAFSATGKYLATGGTDETISIYDMECEVDLCGLSQHGGSITCLEFYEDSFLISASDDGCIYLWKCVDSAAWECLSQLKGHRSTVNFLSIHPSGRLALSVGKDRTLRTWNLVTGKKAFVINLKRVSHCVKWTPKGNSFVAVHDTSIDIYSTETGHIRHSIESQVRLTALCFPTEGMLALADDCGNISLYDCATAKKHATVKGHENRVKGLTVLDKHHMVSVSSDDEVKAWDVKELFCVCYMKLSAARPTCLAAAAAAAAAATVVAPKTAAAAAKTAETRVVAIKPKSGKTKRLNRFISKRSVGIEQFLELKRNKGKWVGTRWERRERRPGRCELQQCTSGCC